MKKTQERSLCVCACSFFFFLIICVKETMRNLLKGCLGVTIKWVEAIVFFVVFGKNKKSNFRTECVLKNHLFGDCKKITCRKALILESIFQESFSNTPYTRFQRISMKQPTNFYWRLSFIFQRGKSYPQVISRDQTFLYIQ